MPWRRTMSRARSSAARRPARRPARRETAVHHRPGQQVEGDDDQRDADGEQAPRGVAVDVGRGSAPTAPRSSRSAEPSRTSGHPGSGWWRTWLATSTPAKAPRVAVTPPMARIRNAETIVPCSVWARKRSRWTTRKTRTAAHSRRSTTSTSCTTWSTERGGEQGHGHQPGAALAPQDAAGEHDHPDAGQGHQRAGGLGHLDGQVLLDQVQVVAQRRGERREQVDQPRPRTGPWRPSGGSGAPGRGPPPPRVPGARRRRSANRPPTRGGGRRPGCAP